MANNIYNCGYCGTTITQQTEPKSGVCPAKKGSHYWTNLGEEGTKNYQCISCSVTVKAKSNPKSGVCSASSKKASHNWKKL